MHEKFREKGGPDGGDGGRGGSIFVVAERNLNTLYEYKTKRIIQADDGENGGSNRQTGASGDDRYLKVPVGTVIYDDETGVQLADVNEENSQAMIASGGEGGHGNAHFTSSVRQTPKVAEIGEPGEEKNVRLELKLIADIGLIGLPNVGKSTLLSVITSAQPKIANYPFTTLVPNLGVVEGERFGLEGVGFLVADIPGLIEGAAAGKGLGDEFLRHIERTKVLVHLIDATSIDPVSDFNKINQELALYKKELINKPQLVVFSKTDAASDLAEKQKEFENFIAKNKKIKLIKKSFIAISAATHDNIKELLSTLSQTLAGLKDTEESKKEEFKIFTANDIVGGTFSVKKENKMFVIEGEKIEKFARKTDFSSRRAKDRFFDILRRLGIAKELDRQGAKPGDKIQISNKITEL